MYVIINNEDIQKEQMGEKKVFVLRNEDPSFWLIEIEI